MVNITPTEEKILVMLARAEPKTYYDLWKHERVASSNKTVLDTLKNLFDRGWTIVKHKKESSGPGLGGRKKKFYGLTYVGLLQALTLKESWEHIDEIAHKHADKLLIFRKWTFFIKNGVRDLVVERLKDVMKRRFILMAIQEMTLDMRDARQLFAKRFSSWSAHKREKKLQDILQNARDMRNVIDPIDHLNRIVLLGEIDIAPAQEQMKFMIVLKKDPDLVSCLETLFDELKRTYTTYLNNLEDWRKWWSRA